MPKHISSAVYDRQGTSFTARDSRVERGELAFSPNVQALAKQPGMKGSNIGKHSLYRPDLVKTLSEKVTLTSCVLSEGKTLFESGVYGREGEIRKRGFFRWITDTEKQQTDKKKTVSNKEGVRGKDRWRSLMRQDEVKKQEELTIKR